MALALACSITAIILYLSPIPLLSQIHRERTTKNFSVLPLAATTLNGAVWAWYGLLTLQYYPMFVVNGIGSLLGATYVVIFCKHATSIKQTAITLIVLFLITAFVLSTYVLAGSNTAATRLDNPTDTTDSTDPPTNHLAPNNLLTNRVGLFGVVVGTCMFAAPFATVRQVLQTQSADSLPFPIIFVNAVNGVLWTMYGLQLNDAYVIGPNALGFVCASLQLALHQRYSNYWCIRHFDSQKRALSLKKMQNDIVNPFAQKQNNSSSGSTVRRTQKEDLEVQVLSSSGIVGSSGVSSRNSSSNGGGGLFDGSSGGNIDERRDLLHVLRV